MINYDQQCADIICAFHENINLEIVSNLIQKVMDAHLDENLIYRCKYEKEDIDYVTITISNINELHQPCVDTNLKKVAGNLENCFEMVYTGNVNIDYNTFTPEYH